MIFKLFFEFFKTGLFAVGGGYATLPFLMEIAEKYPWFSKADLTDMIAISESTPGPLGINMSTFAGFKTAGIPGALLATFALVLPSYIVIVIIAAFLKKFNDNRYVQAAFTGLRPAVVGLITYAIWEILVLVILPEGTKNGILSSLNITAVLLIAVMFGLQFIPKLKNTHPVIWIAIGAILGIVLKL